MEGYRIPKEAYYLRDPGLAPDELAALHLAASAVRMEGANGVEALWKLGGELAEEGPAPAVAALPGAAHLAPLFAAISARRRMAFAYRGRQRRVDPRRLSFRNGHWYLAGFDHDAGEDRSFRLDRLESDVEATEQAGTFQPPPAAATAAAAVGDGRRRPGRPPACWWTPTRRRGRSATSGPTRWRSGGRTARSCWPCGSPTGRRSGRSSSGFLDHAEVLGPPELRDDMVAWLEALWGA